LNNDEEHLAASRCKARLVFFFSTLKSLSHPPVYRPNLKQKSDADILRDAKLEAMGLPPQEEPQRKSQLRRKSNGNRRGGMYLCMDLLMMLTALAGHGAFQEEDAQNDSRNQVVNAFFQTGDAMFTGGLMKQTKATSDITGVCVVAVPGPSVF